MIKLFNGNPLLHFTSLSPADICGEIVETYRLAAEKLGYKTSFSHASFRNDAINILFFYWDKPWSEIEGYANNCIVVNFEPMVKGSHAWNNNYFDVIGKCYLWEYSQTNFQRWGDLGFKVANYVPMGYEDGAAPVLPFDEILPDHEQDIDVIFFGTLTQRRVDLLSRLINMGLNVVLNRIWEGEIWTVEKRNSLLRRSKVALNFHNWENSRIVEVPRLATLLRQRKAVVCELYPDSEIEPTLRRAVVGAPYDGLVDAVVELVGDPGRRKQMEVAALPFLESLQKRDQMGIALERYLYWRKCQTQVDDGMVALSAAICGYIDCIDESWMSTIASISSEVSNCQWILTVSVDYYDALRDAISRLGVRGVNVISLPNGVAKAVALNIALQQVHADLVLFCEPGQVDAENLVRNLTKRLQVASKIDIAVQYYQRPISEIEVVAEESHEISASLLGCKPLPLSRCLIRKSFLDVCGIQHSSEFGSAADLYFLCRCAVSGAVFFGFREQCVESDAKFSNSRNSGSESDFRLRGLARNSLLAHVFPHLTHAETDLLQEIYAYYWAPDPDFASRLLQVMAKACINARQSVKIDKETLSRVFRMEACRLLSVFNQAKLIDQEWIDQQFSVPEVAYFLSPVSPQLPLRPSTRLKVAAA